MSSSFELGAKRLTSPWKHSWRSWLLYGGNTGFIAPEERDDNCARKDELLFPNSSWWLLRRLNKYPLF
jgi:hypothetical protein